MKRPRTIRRSRPTACTDFDAALVTYVETHCPEHFTSRDGQRAIKPEGIIAYLEAVIRGDAPGDRQVARDGIHNTQEIIRYRAAQNQQP